MASLPRGFFANRREGSRPRQSSRLRIHRSIHFFKTPQTQVPETLSDEVLGKLGAPPKSVLPEFPRCNKCCRTSLIGRSSTRASIQMRLLMEPLFKLLS